MTMYLRSLHPHPVGYCGIIIPTTGVSVVFGAVHMKDRTLKSIASFYPNPVAVYELCTAISVGHCCVSRKRHKRLRGKPV